MPLITIVFGLLLVALGYVGYEMPDLLGALPMKEGQVAPPSITALIPAFLGLALILCGLISLAAPGARKHAMHFAAMLGLFGIIGALVRPIMLLTKGELNFGSSPFRSQMLMCLISMIFLYLCVNSFISVRRARKAAAASTTSA
ncbi:hypothetical protein KIH39_07355 [Telmatocola sphagniphila]|jgi:hypothetical protein|uniref:Uncharacterized protein n=1 Tax=Telmatocola sphagniphila TaxID=1123043 RepID=A0A8E6EW81_9BACT|nr:hypothetical protein [Telmatocola sphagniphila]QVL33715.1 hypothetical protein KIH39_07355 [Telmatocola sphagniphila]